MTVSPQGCAVASADRARRLLASLYTAWLELRTGRRGIATLINDESFRILPRARSVAPWSKDRRTRIYEPEVSKVLLDSLRPEDVVVDVGANVGIYTIAAARRVPAGRVWAVEADPHNAQLLREHVRLNGDGLVEVVEAAAGDSAGTIDFSALGIAQSSVEDIWESGRGRRSVVLTRLDAAIPRADVLKIDVEGYEGQVLVGAAGLFADPARRPRLVVLEVHPELLPRAGWSVERVRVLLDVGGYAVDELETHHAQRHWVAIDARRSREPPAGGQES